MPDRDPSQQDTSTTHSTSRLKDILIGYSCQFWRDLALWLARDWRTHKYVFFALLLLLLSVLPTVAYYLNYPQPEFNADTPAYLHVVARLQVHPYLLVDPWRLPGYPLFITFIFALIGRPDLMAVSIAQAVLFVLSALEIYLLALLLLKRAWLAFLVGLLVGTNLVLLSYVKPIMSEGLALWLLTTLALSVVAFLRTMQMRFFWLMVVCLLPLLFTRPEWLFLPILLFAYLLLTTKQRGSGRHLLRSLLVALALLYTLTGSYIALNALVNHYPGLTAIENFNLMGKVLQYDMWREAPPEYAQISHDLDKYVVQIDRDPYHVLPHLPTLAKDYDSPAGAFARTIILHHPVEFLLKSIPLVFLSLTSYFDPLSARSAGPFEPSLMWLKSIHRVLYGWNALFPGCVVVWFLLLFWKRARSQQRVREMGGIILIVLYGLVITTLGGYRLDDYMRVHIVFDPLLILSIWGSLLLGAVPITHWIGKNIVGLKKKFESRMEL